MKGRPAAAAAVGTAGGRGNPATRTTHTPAGGTRLYYSPVNTHSLTHSLTKTSREQKKSTNQKKHTRTHTQAEGTMILLANQPANSHTHKHQARRFLPTNQASNTHTSTISEGASPHDTSFLTSISKQQYSTNHIHSLYPILYCTLSSI